MTRRNIQNERNTYKKPKGVARKSASSAKPVSKAGSSVYVRSKDTDKKKGSSRSKADKPVEKKASDSAEQLRRRERAMVSMMRDTPEYKRYRRMWWIFMAVAIVGVIVSWLPNMLVGNGIISSDYKDVARVVAGAGFVIAMLALVGAFYIDLGKIRKLQKNQENKARTLTKSERRKLDAAIAESIEKEEQRRAERKGKMPWNRGKSEKESKADDKSADDDASASDDAPADKEASEE